MQNVCECVVCTNSSSDKDLRDAVAAAFPEAYARLHEGGSLFTARRFAGAARGSVTAGTGANMSG